MYCLLPVVSSDLDHGVIFRDMEELSRENGLHMQCLDPALILGRRHLDTAFVNAVANFSSGKNFTRSFPVELVLMLSGQRQIKEAFALFGISSDVDSFLVFSCSADAVDAAVRDFSIERWADHGKKFESEFSGIGPSGAHWVPQYLRHCCALGRCAYGPRFREHCQAANLDEIKDLSDLPAGVRPSLDFLSSFAPLTISRDDVMMRTRELITTLGLAVPENEQNDLFSPVGSKIVEAFALAGIPWPEGGMRDLRRTEKAMCEKINLMRC